MYSVLLLAVLLRGVAQAHVVSISNGELHVDGRTATFELRIPSYELVNLPHPETTLLDQLKFEGAHRTMSACLDDSGTYVCHAAYEFERPMPDKIGVECTLFKVTVPNHVHLLYAVQGQNSDQVVFDQSVWQSEVRFHPPSATELLVRNAAAGIGRLFKSLSGIMFLAALALAARSRREAAILVIAFVTAEFVAHSLAPHIPLSFSQKFLEAVLALTVAYLAAEIVFLPDSRARWMVIPLLGLLHGLPYAAFPPSYLGGAAVVQAILLAMLFIASSRIPPDWRSPAGAGLLAAGLGWFTRQLFP